MDNCSLKVCSKGTDDGLKCLETFKRAAAAQMPGREKGVCRSVPFAKGIPYHRPGRGRRIYAEPGCRGPPGVSITDLSQK